jgi:hypothetical protein
MIKYSPILHVYQSKPAESINSITQVFALTQYTALQREMRMSSASGFDHRFVQKRRQITPGQSVYHKPIVQLPVRPFCRTVDCVPILNT